MKENNVLSKDRRNRSYAVNMGASWVANVGKIIIQLVMLPLMARLLGPAEFGLYALALPVVSFAIVLADGGLGTSLAREDELNTTLWSTAFWLLLGVCSFTAVIVTGVGLILAHISGKPELAGIIALLSICLIFLALSVLPSARLAKRGNLLYHSIGDLGATCVGALLGLILALNGYGAWSLAWQFVTAFAIRVIVLNIGGFEKPRFVFQLRSLSGHFVTGGALLVCKAMDLLGRTFENLLFAQTLGPHSLGVFTLAQQIIRFLCDAALNPVWTSLYVYGLREPLVSTATLHVRLTQMLSILVLPAASFLAVVAPILFALVLGSKWSDAAPMLQILAPFYAMSAISELCGAVLVSRGRNAIMILNVGGMVFLRIIVIMFGGKIGESGVAVGLSMISLLYAVSLYLSLNVLLKLGAGMKAVFAAVFPALISTAIACATGVAILHIMDPNLITIAISLFVSGGVYVASLLFMRYSEIRTELTIVIRFFRRDKRNDR